MKRKKGYFLFIRDYNSLVWKIMKTRETPQSLVFETRLRKSVQVSPIKKSPQKISKEYCKPVNRIPLRRKISSAKSEIHIQQCATEEPMSPRTHQRPVSPRKQPLNPDQYRKESSIPTERLIQRIKMNLSLIEYKMSQLFEEQINQQTKDSPQKFSGGKSGSPKIQRSTSRNRLQRNQKFEGCLTHRKKLQQVGSYKTFQEKGWK